MRRRLSMQRADEKTECVTRVVNPCAFDSLPKYKNSDIVFANLVAGKTYRITVNADVTVTETITDKTTDFYLLRWYGTWRNEYLGRKYGIQVGTYHFAESKEMPCYVTGNDVLAFTVYSGFAKGTVTINSISIKEA